MFCSKCGKPNEGNTEFCIQQTSDGGFVITGETWSYASANNDCDAWLVKKEVH